MSIKLGNKDIKEIYIGVNGEKRKIKEGYIGVNGILKKIYSLNSSSWEWNENFGSTFEENKQWWDSLASQVGNISAEDRLALVGKEPIVYLNTEFLGVNANVPISVICIGADQDGEGTLTFQTKGALQTPIKFTTMVWSTSTAKTECDNFAKACSAYNAMAQIIKLTCTHTGSRQSEANIETKGKCWLPSEQEMGLNAFSPSAKECTKGAAIHMGYKYYENNNKRIKYKINTDGTLSADAVGYWERSRFYNTNGYICYVDKNGGPQYNLYSAEFYLAPAFTIGKVPA